LDSSLSVLALRDYAQLRVEGTVVSAPSEGEIINRPILNAVDLAAQVGKGGEFHIEYILKDVVRLTPQDN